MTNPTGHIMNTRQITSKFLKEKQTTQEHMVSLRSIINMFFSLFFKLLFLMAELVYQDHNMSKL